MKREAESRIQKSNVNNRDGEKGAPERPELNNEWKKTNTNTNLPETELWYFNLLTFCAT